MSIQVNWDNDEKTIIAYTSSGRYIWEEFYAAIDEVHKLAEAVDYPLVVIMNLRESIPPSGALTHFRNAIKRSPSNISHYIIIGTDSFRQMLISMAFHVMFARSSSDFVFTDSIANAHKAAQEVLPKGSPDSAEH